MTKELSIIIVNWNAGKYLLDCVASIYKTVDIKFEIILVDNNSSDGSIDAVKSVFKEVLVIEKNINLGFSKADNLAAKKSTGDYLLFLNPDTIVMEGAIDSMVRFLRGRPDIGILGPKSLDSKGSINLNCKDNIPDLFDDFLRLFLVKKLFNWTKIKLYKYPMYRRAFFSSYDGPGECGTIEGSCMLIRQDNFKMLGGFSEDLPMFLDDIDLCIRCARSGLKVFYLSSAEIVHFGRQSINQREDKKMYDVMSLQARIFYYKRHFGLVHAILFRSIVLFSVPYLLIVDLIMLPSGIIKNRLGNNLWVIKKHMHYLGLVFSDKIINVL